MDRIERVLIDQLDATSLSLQEKQAMLDVLLPLLREKKERIDFLNARVLKDKHIAVNLLNQAIDDLQAKQQQIQSANLTLTEQKKLLEEQSHQLRESLARLEMSYEELEQFSYIASHDLKSPLRTIASYAQLLQRRYGGRLDQEADEYINFIVSGAMQMNVILNDLLNYAVVRDHREGFEWIDLNDTLNKVRFNLYSEITETNALIETGPLPCRLEASPSGMLQLFQNLIGNAVKFRGAERPHVQVSATQKDDHWLFQVQDNGLGLDESFSKKAFLPFQRLSDPKLPGSGIGLAICKKIVKLHGGRIWYTSEPGKGTTFWFTVAQRAGG